MRFAHRLRQVAVHRRHALVRACRRSRYSSSAQRFRWQKMMHCRGCSRSMHAQQQVELPVLVHGDVRLADVLDRELVRRQVDVDRVDHVALGQPQHRRRQRGRQQQRLPLLRAAAQDLLDVGAEADVEHAVGLVEDDVADAVERQRAAARWSRTRPGRADDDGDALASARRAAGGSAGRRRSARSGNAGSGASLLASSRDLDDQLAGRRQDEGLRARARCCRASRSGTAAGTRRSCRCRSGPGR